MGVTYNKGITSSPPSIEVIAIDSSATSVTGTVSETLLRSVPIPPLAANDALRITTFWQTSNTNAAKSCILRLGNAATAGPSGGTQVLNMQSISVSSIQTIGTVIRNVNSTAVQKFFAPIAGSFGQGTTSIGVSGSTIETGSGSYINICGTLTSAGDTMSIQAYTIELLRS